MRRRSAFPILGLLALAGCVTASAPQSGPVISAATLQRVTQTLSSDAFEGRAPGTPGEERTVALLAEEFQRAGLRPGNNGSWFQDVPLVEITLQGSPRLQIAGRGQTLTFNYRTDYIGASYRAQPRVSVENSDIVFVGYGINAPERGWNDYEGVDVRGKTVVILVNDPDWQSAALTGTFGGRAMTYYGRWTYKFEEAARQGAAAALIVHDTAPASYGWMTVENSWSGPQPYMQTPNDGADQTAMNGWLTNDAARRLMAAAGQDLDALTRAAQQRGFRAVPLGLTASVTLDNQVRRFASRNVIGVLPGRTRPDEYVLYTSHWDHLGACTENGEDRICNGAVDNASGTSSLVALAEAHARAGAADRTLVFLAVTAEESGLLGSAYYAANPIFPLARTAGGFNMNSLNLAGPARDFVSIGGGKFELDAYLAPRAAQAGGVRVSPEPAPEAGYYFRSDQFSLAKRGVPMLYGRGGEDLVNGGPAAGRAASQDYRANRYHGVNDEYDPAWDWSGALADVGIYYRVGRELATTDAWPNWLPGDEFRAVRDQSRAGQSAPPPRQPPEWAPHAFVWIGFPSHGDLWESDLSPAQAEVAAFAKAVWAKGKGEEVRLVAADAASAEAARAAAPFATIVTQPFGDIWLRDTGPIVVKGPAGLSAMSFGFNGWGGKYDLPGDDTIGRRLGEGAGLKVRRADWIFEGGAIDVDGTGLAATTEQCLMNPNRNAFLSRGEIEAKLQADLGIGRVLWLGSGLMNDHTDGHVDNLARFVGTGRIAIPEPEGTDPNEAVYRDAANRARRFGLEVVPLPSPGCVTRGEEIIPASYMNFYIGDAAVVVPQYGAANDAAAVEAVQALFPGRKAVGLRADHILTGGGSFHCISQQVPR